MILYLFTKFAALINIGFALFGILPLVWITLEKGDLDTGIGLLGIFIGMVGLGLGNLSGATSSRTGDKQYNKLSEKIDGNTSKIDNIASQQEELIALVKSTIQTSQDEDSSPESPTDPND